MDTESILKETEFLLAYGEEGEIPRLHGSFELSIPLTVCHRAYLARFCRTRRFRRDAEKTAGRSDPIRRAVDLPVGPDGAFFVGANGPLGEEHLPENGETLSQWKERIDRIGIFTYDWDMPPRGVPISCDFLNLRASRAEFVPLPTPPIMERTDGFYLLQLRALAQPALWCPWTPSENGAAIIENDSGTLLEHVHARSQPEVSDAYDFRQCVEWLEYLIENLLAPWGYVVNGEVTWQIEERWDDRGAIAVTENVVKADYG